MKQKLFIACCSLTTLFASCTSSGKLSQEECDQYVLKSQTCLMEYQFHGQQEKLDSALIYLDYIDGKCDSLTQMGMPLRKAYLYFLMNDFKNALMQTEKMDTVYFFPAILQKMLVNEVKAKEALVNKDTILANSFYQNIINAYQETYIEFKVITDSILSLNNITDIESAENSIYSNIINELIGYTFKLYGGKNAIEMLDSLQNSINGANEDFFECIREKLSQENYEYRGMFY